MPLKYRRPYGYKTDPEAFAVDILGVKMHEGLAQFLNLIRDNKHVVVAGCFGSAKTFSLAVAAMWFLNTNTDSKVATTAPGQRQVRDLLWSEIRALHKTAKIKLSGAMLTERFVKGEKWYAAGFTGQKYNESSFQGYHARRIMYGIDEATGVDSQVFTARRKLLMNSEDKFIAIGNALDSNTEFARAFADPTFAKLRITAFDTPNVKAGKIVIPGMVTSDWVKEMEPLHGTALYKTYVLAEFPEENENSLFPLSWIEKAFLRWDELQGQERIGKQICGCDVATSGSDLTVIANWTGNVCESIRTYTGLDTQETANHLEMEAKRGYRIAVDSIGVGAGVADTLSHRGYSIVKVIGSETSLVKDSTYSFEFVNKRSELYWTLHELMDPANPQAIALPRDERLREELSVHTYEPVAGGKIRVLQKEKVKDLLGRSPDRSDALAISLAARNAQAFSAFGGESIIKARNQREQTRSKWY